MHYYKDWWLDKRQQNKYKPANIFAVVGDGTSSVLLGNQSKNNSIKILKTVALVIS